MEEQDPETSSRQGGKYRQTAEESEKRLAHFLRMLSDENPGNRWKAADSLGRLGDLRATEPLINALWDEDVYVRKKAAWALGSLGDPRAIAPLRRLYRMENPDSQGIIEEALAEINRGMSGK
jgi:HEAT repeat protein